MLLDGKISNSFQGFENTAIIRASEHFNITVMEHAPRMSESSWIKFYTLIIMAVLSLGANIVTMWNIYKTQLVHRGSRHNISAIYMLIFHLSIADLLVTVFCIIGEAAWIYTVQWIADNITCKVVKVFQMFSLYLSTYVLVLIAVDRWMAVRYPMKSLTMAKRCYRILGGIYIMSLILSSPQYVIFHVAKGPFIEDFYQCVTHGFYSEDWQEQLYVTITMLLNFLLPLCLLTVMYLSIFRTISSSEKMFECAVPNSKYGATTNRQRLIYRAKIKTLRMSIAIICAFLICWTPYNIMVIIFMFSAPGTEVSKGLNNSIFCFGMSNSLINPLIYGAFHLPGIRCKRKYNIHLHSWTRYDWQRVPSLLTTLTQDENGRQTSRTLHQTSLYRSTSNSSNTREFIVHVEERNYLKKSTTVGSSAGLSLKNNMECTASLMRDGEEIKVSRKELTATLLINNGDSPLSRTIVQVAEIFPHYTMMPLRNKKLLLVLGNMT